MNHVTIKQAIETQIHSGVLSPGHKLPSERSLAETFKTTRITLREALSILENEGQLYREDRRGWFISPPPLREQPSLLSSFPALAQAQQKQPRIDLLSAEVTLAAARVAEHLALAPFAEVYSIEQSYFLDQRPVCWVTHQVPHTAWPGLLDRDLNQSLQGVFEQEKTPYHAVDYQLKMSALTGKAAQVLRASVGTPALLIERVFYQYPNRPICVTSEYWRHDAIVVESRAHNG